jgi:UDP-glucose 4-epimerase
MNVLVTGATGFVGLHTVRHLASHGARIISLSHDDLDETAERFLGPARSAVTIVHGDVRDRDLVLAVGRRERAERFVHAAALTPSVELERASPAAIVDINLGGTVNILEAARACGARRVVFVSSSVLYGRPDDPDALLSEDTPPRAAALYAICKVCGEQLCRRYASLCEMSIVAARVGTVYGPMERPTSTRRRMSEVYALARAAMTRTPVSVYGADVRRDYCYAEDVGEALARLTLADTLAWETYNVGTGTTHSVREVAVQFANLLPGFVWRPVDDAAAADVVVLPDKERGPLNPARVHRDLNYSPQYPLPRGLSCYLDWLRTAAGT